MSAATQNADRPVASFPEHFVEVDGMRLRYLKAGQGKPVVIIDSANNLTSSPLNVLLARQFQVIVMEMPDVGRSLRDQARTLANAVAALGLEHYELLSTGTSAPLALWHALDAPQCVDALVLISPMALPPDGETTPSGFTRDPALERQLGDLRAPTLVLLGTRDEVLPADTGRLYAERLPHCYYTLVYDAGHEIAADRPEALCAAVCDFLEQRETFVVSRQSTVINP